METQLHRSYGTHEEQPQLPRVPEGGEVEQHEKKSVLKKVKAKAKKIKDSIKHLGHDHDQEHEHDQEDEEEDDEEMVDDPEIHGAPIYDSSAIRSGVVPHQDVGMVPKSGSFDDPSSRKEGGLDSNVTSEDNMRTFLHTVGEGRKDSAKESEGLERTEREPGARFGVLTGSQEHPQAPMEKLDQSKVTHPQTAQRAEAGVPPLVESFGKMSVDGGTGPNSRKQDNLDSNVPIEDDMRRSTHPMEERPVEHYSHVPIAHHEELGRTERAAGPKFDAFPELQQDPRSPLDKSNPSNQSKVSDPTGQRAEEAGAPPLVTSIGKMTVEDETKPSSIGKSSEQKGTYTGSHDQFSPETIPTSTHFSPESTPKQFDLDSTKPEGEMPIDTIDGKPSPGQGPNTYTEKISSAAYGIADKAVSAKNVVASKLGYGGGNVEAGTPTKPKNYSATDSGHVAGDVEGDTNTKSQQSYAATEYAQKAAAAVSDTLAPIYGKVAGVGSAVVSKVPGIGTGKEEGEARISESSMNESKGRGASMKEYIAEKLRPGEEDKALSEVITDSLHVQKEKSATEGGNPMEKVTESDEVEMRLGSGEENRREGSDALVAGSESSGNTVVEKITDAVTSWVTKGGESPTSHQGAPAASSQNVQAS